MDGNKASAVRPGLYSQACPIEGTQVSCTHLSHVTTWKELFSTAAVLPGLRQSSTSGLETRGFSLTGCGQQSVNPLQRKQFKDTTTKSFKEQRKLFTQSVIGLRSPSQRRFYLRLIQWSWILFLFNQSCCCMKNELKVTRWWRPVLGRDESGVCGCCPEREEGTQTGTVLNSEGRLLLVKWKHSFLLSKCCRWKNKQTNELTNQPTKSGN